MEIFGKDLDNDFVLIAEIGVNHEGSLEKAKELIHLAHEAGADAVKLQSYTPDRFIGRDDPERFARVTKFGLSERDHAVLFSFAETIGCRLFSTPVTEDWVTILDQWVPAFKIASGDLTFEPVIRACARTGKKVILSTGASTIDEVSRAVGWFADEVGAEEVSQRLVLLHCVSSYPVPIEQSSLLTIPFLKDKFGLKIGYSNHVVGAEACIAAAVLGASVFEVHFTDRREGKVFRDHLLSMEPTELKSLKGTISRVRAALGSFDKRVMECEAAMVKQIRKGLIAWKTIELGQIVSVDDVAYARPATKLSSLDLGLVVGKRANRQIVKGELLDAGSFREA